MKAAWFETFGPAQEVLTYGEREKPNPGPGEVLVRVKTSGVNPSDVKKRAGSAPGLLDNGAVIPHSDGAGIIEEVGQGVSRARIGERVWTYNAQYGRSHGTAAEYVCIPAQTAVWMPDNVDFETGACIGIPIMTAHRCVFADRTVRGKTVLVSGGAGRVGNYAIQLAKMDGATVIATAGSEASKQACLDAGADAVISHPHAKTGAELMEVNAGQKADRVIEGEFGANFPFILDTIKMSGTVATYASMEDKNPAIPFYQTMYLDVTLRFVIVYAMPDFAKEEAMDDITALLTNNQLIHRIAATYPLSE
ncbi:MAG: NADPH:quinone reductase, partial [Bacteroidota bacterium]